MMAPQPQEGVCRMCGGLMDGEPLYSLYCGICKAHLEDVRYCRERDEEDGEEEEGADERA